MSLIEGENARHCLTCDKLKEFSNFGKAKRGKYGLRSKCKECRSNYAKKLNKRNEYLWMTEKNFDKFRDKLFERKRIRSNERYRNDDNFRLRKVLRTRLYKAVTLEYKSGSAIDMLGCSIDELKEHLEEQFEKGMSWDNYGVCGWEIDHIKPCASFDLTDPEQQAECFHYTNLQPLWELDNKLKSDKII